MSRYEDDFLQVIYFVNALLSSWMNLEFNELKEILELGSGLFHYE